MGLHSEIEDLAPASVYELPDHTVTITEMADVDFVGNAGFRLGLNQVRSELLKCAHLVYPLQKKNF